MGATLICTGCRKVPDNFRWNKPNIAKAFEAMEIILLPERCLTLQDSTEIHFDYRALLARLGLQRIISTDARRLLNQRLAENTCITVRDRLDVGVSMYHDRQREINRGCIKAVWVQEIKKRSWSQGTGGFWLQLVPQIVCDLLLGSVKLEYVKTQEQAQETWKPVPFSGSADTSQFYILCLWYKT